MFYIETKQGHIAKVTGAASEILTKSGQVLYKNIPTVHLSNPSNKYQVHFLQGHLFIGWKGLQGGGNCANAPIEVSPPKQKKKSIAHPHPYPNSHPQPPMNTSIKTSFDLFITKDDISENNLKKHLNILKEKLKIGEPLFNTLKEILDEPIVPTWNFLQILMQILEILAMPFLYYKKEYAQVRAKLSVLARKLVVYAKVTYKGAVDDEILEKFRGLLQKALSLNKGDFFHEVYFECNLVALLGFVDKFNFNLNSQIEQMAEGLFACLFKGAAGSEVVNQFSAACMKMGQNWVVDLMMLELIPRDAELGVIQGLIDSNLSGSWERIAVILTRLKNSPEELAILGDYLYFSNSEIKEVWKIRYICLEILLNLNYPYNKESPNIEKILEAKFHQEDDEPIKNLQKNLEFYKHTLTLLLKVQKLPESNEYLHKFPTIPLSQCDTSNLELLLKSPSKVISITGPAGSGKTTLALSYTKLKLDYYYLIFFIPSQSERLVIKTFVQLSRRLKLIIQDCADEMVSAVKRYLNKETRPFLLIFDGVESIDTIKNYIPSAGHVLITSTTHIWPLRYEIFPLEENFVKIFLAEFYSKKLSDGLRGNYMAIGLAIKLLKWNKARVSDLEEALLTENSVFGVLSVVVETINAVIPGSKDTLFCLCLLENTYVPRDLLIEICVFLKQPQHYYDLILYELDKYKLIDEYKNFSFILNSTLYNYLSAKLQKPIFYVNVLKQAYFSILPDCSFLNISKLEVRISILLMKFSSYLVHDYSIDTGAIFFLKGKYEFLIEQNIKEAISSFELALKCIKSVKSLEQVKFALGCSYLKDFRAADSISMFIQAIESSLDPEYKLISNAFLTRAYDYLGNSSKIAEIIIHTNDTNFQQLTLPEAVYCTIHGICSLSLNEEDLQELLLPYSSFLYSRAPSITLFVTLLKLCHTFAVKKQWRIVLNYVNLITPLVHIESIPMPKSSNAILEILEQLLIAVKGKVQDFVGETHRMVALLYLILAKVYEEQGNTVKLKQCLNSTLKIRKEAFGEVHIFVADVYYELGKFYYKFKKNGKKTVKLAKQAETIIIKSKSDDYLIHAKTLELYGLGYILKNKYEKSYLMLHRALILKQKILSKSTENQEILKTYSNLGKVELKQENFKSALEWYEKALNPNKPSPKPYSWVQKVVNLSTDLNLHSNALKYQQLYLANLDPEHSKPSEFLYQEYLKALNISLKIPDLPIASQIAKKSLKILKDVNKSSKTLNESKHLIKFADVLTKLGKTEESEKLMHLAVNSAREQYGPSSDEFIHSQFALGIFYKQQEKYEEACQCLRDLVEKTKGTIQGKIFKETGICYMKMMDSESGFIEFEKALIVFKEYQSYLDVAQIYQIFAHYCKDDKLTCIDYLEEAYKVLVDHFGEDHQESVACLDKIKECRKDL